MKHACYVIITVTVCQAEQFSKDVILNYIHSNWGGNKTSHKYPSLNNIDLAKEVIQAKVLNIDSANI